MKQVSFRLALLFIDLFPLNGKKLKKYFNACNSQTSKTKKSEKVREQSENTTI